MSRLLIIDDEASSRLILQNRLKEAGHRVDIAESGAQGLHAAREENYDLILLDDGLSAGVDGYEVCRRLKQSLELANVPVVLISRQAASKENLAKGYASGCETYVPKAEMPVLEEIIAGILRRKAKFDDVLGQMRAIEGELRRRAEGAGGGNGSDSPLKAEDITRMVRDVAGGTPDGLLLVDAEGIVRMADRGIREILGNRLEGTHLGRLAPGSGLEAFVRDAQTEPREGFRFDLAAGSGRVTARMLSASVVPLVASPGERDPGLRVLAIVDLGRRRVVAELMRAQEGASPRGDIAELVEIARAHCGPASLIGISPDIQQIRGMIASAAKSAHPVYLQGEPGVGKKHVARALHFTSGVSGPYLSVHCGALDSENLALELFGQVKDAVPGALFDRPGAFQRAQSGTLLLEHVERLSAELQADLLRAVRDREVLRRGSDRVERVSGRLLVTSSVDLVAAAEEGSFDRELYDLLSDLEIEIPPLRERSEDVGLLAQHFLERYRGAHNALELSEDVLLVMQNYDWPENVRELGSCIERACAEAESSEIRIEHLSQALRDLQDHLEGKQVVPSGPGHLVPGTHNATSDSLRGKREPRQFDITDDDPPNFDVYERKLLLRALDQTGGDKLAAARLLGVGKSTLYRKLKKHGIR